MTDDLVARLRRTLAGIARDECGGDNLSILLASYFEPAIEDDELDDSGTWKQGAIDACNKVLDAIHQHYATAIEAAEARVRELEAEVDALRHDLERQMTIANAECNRAETAEARLSTIEAGAIERCTTVALVPVEATGQIKSAISAFVRSRAIPSPSDLDPDDIYFDNGDAGELYEDIVSAARTGGEA